MEMRQLGKLWPVSALTLGGGGLGQIWGATTRDEAVATVRAAADAGITLFDMAPLYGRGEAEAVMGASFEGKWPDGIQRHHQMHDRPAELFPMRRGAARNSR